MEIPADKIDPDAAKVVQRLKHHDHRAYLVGGCVRDLLLGRVPKDFDVATSATPQEIRRLFRNCRVIGRRFRLAHIFFGPKIIETSTFRANPRAGEEDDGDVAPETESGDLFIRRDNVFGTEEEDARRRDFTLNALFYDPEERKLIDHVGGLADLEARLIRTIGDPNVRFREDPVRILRAIKFAARLTLSIEPETYRLMLANRGELAKCAPARISEEIYRLMRGGAARRSMELLAETGALEVLAPELDRVVRGDSADPAAEQRRARTWAYLGALDRRAAAHPVTPSNGLVLAVLLLPFLRDALEPSSSGLKDIGAHVFASAHPLIERLHVSRRDAELARQVLLALRFLLPTSARRRRPRLGGRDFYDDAMALCALVVDAETREPAAAMAAGAGASAAQGDADTAASEGEDGGESEDFEEELPRELVERPSRRQSAGHRGPEPRRPPAQPNRPAEVAFAPWAGTPQASVPRDARGLPIVLPPVVPTRPPFLGQGGFGGRWSVLE